MFAQNVGNQLLQTEFTYPRNKYYLHGGFDLGTWKTAAKDVNISVEGFTPASQAAVTILASDHLQAANTKTNPTCVTPYDIQVKAGKEFVYHSPAYSVSVLRLQAD